MVPLSFAGCIVAPEVMALLNISKVGDHLFQEMVKTQVFADDAADFLIQRMSYIGLIAFGLSPGLPLQ